MNLVIVESPAKARTIGKILGTDFVIKASMGHVRDLPKKELGIDITNNFKPKYVVVKQRSQTISELKKIAESVSAVYLATDPDREGEAISWHIVETAKLDKNKLPIHRVVFHEITKEAVEEAFRSPRSINMNLVKSQQARRLLDRLVGYKISPLLWRKVQRGLSAGRVQSAALRLVVDREREIQSFICEEYWNIKVELVKSSPKVQDISFLALLVGLVDGTKLHIPTKKDAEELQKELYRADYSVKTIQVKDVFRQPSPPFITSTLQQEAWRKLRFTASRTMLIAQQLYEGVSVGGNDQVGLITYMRTDSTNVSANAIAEARGFIETKYGKDFVPLHPRHFTKKRKFAQEAHEAIRPTKVHREPAQLRHYLTSEQAKLYELIWRRMVASQMAQALFEITTVDVIAKCPENQKRDYLLRSVSSMSKFLGFMSLYIEGKDEGESENGQTVRLPRLNTGDRLIPLDTSLEQNFTQPLPRYTEATLIKALEQQGIGRPSTYATIISTIQERGYVLKEKGRMFPDDVGFIVSDLLAQHFPKIIDLSFTARMEKDLDDIAQGDQDWVSVLRTFYTPFEKTLHTAGEAIEKINVAKMTSEICPDCGRPMVIKIGRYGKFLACSGYPECKKTMALKVTTGIPCPECKDGELMERISKKRRRFYGCSRYPKCQFAINRKPISQPCPKCGKLLIQYRNNWVKCTSCDFKEKSDELVKVRAAS